MSLGDLDGQNGFRLDGSGGEISGQTVASVGDVDGDGKVDLVIDISGDHHAFANFVL